MRKFLAIAVATAATLIAYDATAYPTSIIFMPTAESRKLAQVGAFVYGYTVMSPMPDKFTVGPWFGAEVGVMPPIMVGRDKDIELGGAEVGIDFLGPGDGTVKPVLNAKLTFVKQFGWFPSLGAGFMQFAFANLPESLSVAYAMATETFYVDRNKTNIGSLSFGFSHSFAPTVPAGEEPIFHGTAPFPFDSRWALVGGYLSPTVYMLSIGVEYVGGYSENSATTAGLFFTPWDWLYLSAGAWFTNDRSPEYRTDGPWVMVGGEWEFLKKEEEAATGERQARALKGLRRLF